MRTWCIVLPLVPLQVGDVIDRSAWAPHITLVGDLSAPGDPLDLLAELVHRVARHTAPVTATVGPEARFGVDGSVLVDLVEAPGLADDHERMLRALESTIDGLRLDVPEHSREGYRPHRTVTTGRRPEQGETVVATEIALVELEPEDRPGTGLVVALFRLGDARTATAEEVTDADALEVLDALDAAGVHAVVIGGWGVDALAGRWTRGHHDLDLLVEGDDLARTIEALRGAGFPVRSTWSENRWTPALDHPKCSGYVPLPASRSGEYPEHFAWPAGDGLLPCAFIAADATGREVDVHAVDVVADRAVPRHVSTIELPAAGLRATGTIGGRTVRCATAEAQLVMHTGYDLPERQRPDIELLRSV